MSDVTANGTSPRVETRTENGRSFQVEVRPDGSEWLLGEGGVGMRLKAPVGNSDTGEASVQVAQAAPAPVEDTDLSAAYMAHRDQQRRSSTVSDFLREMEGDQTAQGSAEAATVDSVVKPAARAAADAAAMGTATAALDDGEETPLADKAVAVAKDIGLGLVEAPVQALGGVSDGVHQTFTALDNLAWWLEEKLPLGTFEGVNPLKEAAGKENEIAKGETVTGGIVRDVAQFLTGFIPAIRGARAVGVGERVAGSVASKVGEKAAARAGQFVEGAGAGAVSSFFTLDPYEEGLSNLVQKHPTLANPVNEFLSADPNDNEAVARFKKAVEGLGFGIITEGIVLGVQALRSLRLGGGGKGGTGGTPAGGPGGGGGSPVAEALERDLATLGDPEAPLLQVVRREGSDVADAMKATETGVPDDVAAKGVATAGNQPGSWPIKFDGGEVYVNWARISTEDDVKAVLRDMADAFKPDIDAAKRGVRTHADTALSAEQVNAWDTLLARRTGQPLNAEETVAVRNLWASSGQHLLDVAEAAAANPSEANLFAFRRMMAIHHTVQNQVLAARAETARALNAWAIPAGGSSEKLRSITMMLESGGGAEVTRDLATRVAALKQAGMFEELDEVVRKGVYATTRDAVLEAWVMGLLSNPKTHVVNTMSNTAVMGQQILERGLAAKISQLFGTEAGVQTGEATAQIFGLVSGLKDALRYAGKAARTGETGFGLGKVEAPRTGMISSEAFHLSADTWLGRAVDGLGFAVRLPGRALGAEDEFFKTAGYRMELWAQAYRQASGEVAAGKIGADQLKTRIADIAANPPENIRLAAADAALYQTFSNQPGKLGQWMMKGVQEVPELRLLVPFIRTPTNILTYTFERSPLAPVMSTWRADVAAGGARRDLALAKMSMGTAVMLATMDLAMSGQISGNGPVNPAQKAAMQRQGWQPNSVKIGDRWYSYSRTDPLGATLGLAANFAEFTHNTDWDGEDMDDMGEVQAAIIGAIGSTVMSKTYLQGLSEFFEAMADPKRNSENYLNRLAGSLVPASVSEVARQEDPVMRAAWDMVDSLKRRTPGLSKDLPAVRDLWGREVSYRSGLGAGYDAISPIVSRKAEDSPIDAEILRLGANVRMPPKRIGVNGVGVNLKEHPEAYYRYVELSGNGIKLPQYDGLGAKDFLDKLVTGKSTWSEVYQMRSDGPDGRKAEFIRKVIQDYREAARAQLLDEFPELRAEYEDRARTRSELKMPVVQ